MHALAFASRIMLNTEASPDVWIDTESSRWNILIQWITSELVADASADVEYLPKTSELLSTPWRTPMISTDAWCYALHVYV